MGVNFKGKKQNPYGSPKKGNGGKGNSAGGNGNRDDAKGNGQWEKAAKGSTGWGDGNREDAYRGNGGKGNVNWGDSNKENGGGKGNASGWNGSKGNAGGWNGSKGSTGGWNGSKENGKRPNGRPQGYIGAPYNFIPFYKDVYQYPKEKLVPHNKMAEELITGELTYGITAKTPILVDDGENHFYKDAKGRYAIPGSTMRGLIRNNVQILGLAGYDDDIDDYDLMYRNVAYGAEKKRYDELLGSKQVTLGNGANMNVLLNVRAGYVENQGGKYVIYQTCVDSIQEEFKEMNYYVLSEKKIINDYLEYGDKFGYGFFNQNGRNILQHEFEEFREEADRKNKDKMHYKGTPNKGYRPYYKPVSYKITHVRNVAAVGNVGQYPEKGYAVSTGKMNEKKVVYIIPEIDRSKETIEIGEKDIRAFQIDMKRKEKTLKQFGGRACFDLPEEGKMRPVFYIQYGGRLYFGFTPRLRLFYDHSIKDGLAQNFSKDKVDYVKSLFGYSSGENGSYKSKVSFSDAVAEGEVKPCGGQKLVLAEPKPTSYCDYLKPDRNNPVTYNADKFELRGAKQYWLHKKPVETNLGKNEKVASAISPLPSNTKFQGKIRFRNLTEDELGLLLWAVRLNENSEMNVGKAKAFGYGRISLEIVKAERLDFGKAYASDGELDFAPFGPIDVDAAIAAYKEKMKVYLKGEEVDGLAHIKDFFLMKDGENIPEDGLTRYMDINAREYQSRKMPLPEVSKVAHRP